MKWTPASQRINSLYHSTFYSTRIQPRPAHTTNMKASIILSSIAAGVALASPVAQSNIPEGENVTLFCNNKDFGAYCAYIPTNNEVCGSLTARHRGTTSSVAPSEGSLCYFFV